MDLVADDSRSLERSLGVGDRGRLDAYLTSVRDLEKRLVEAEAWADRPKPVVPITALTPSSRHTFRWAKVPSGRVKSIRNCDCCKPALRSLVTSTPLALPMAAPASVPMAGLLGMSRAPVRLQSSALAMASMSM
jgi:hypothetical protein